MSASIWLTQLIAAVSDLSLMGAAGGAAQENASDICNSEQGARNYLSELPGSPGTRATLKGIVGFDFERQFTDFLAVDIVAGFARGDSRNAFSGIH